ncbi:MAG: TIGR03936 family radical SAM-associated protein [Coriobacteriales bacterium]|nr:TIGR03936 family radical SAM-associated protein [Coriobacteriales bacterium]
MNFRLRLDFQKHGRLRFLSHLEVVRALERMIRRAQLPYAVSQGFNTHMRYAPGPALPVGTVGLDEHFDLWLTEYLNPALALGRLGDVGLRGLTITAASYVDPRAKGLQATHIHEEYKLVIAVGGAGAVSGVDGVAGAEGDASGTDNDVGAEGDAGGVSDANGAETASDANGANGAETLSASEIVDGLTRVIATGALSVRRGKKNKDYDLTQAIDWMPVACEGQAAATTCEGQAAVDYGERKAGDIVILTMGLRATERGTVRPELLLRAALVDKQGWELKSVVRTRLYEDKELEVS